MIPTLDEVDVWLPFKTLLQRRRQLRYLHPLAVVLAFQVLAGYIIYLFAGIYSFLSSVNYVSLNIVIALVLKFYFTFLDWTRQHPATNGGTGDCEPFFSTSHYFQVQLPTVFHRARRPKITQNASWIIFDM